MRGLNEELLKNIAAVTGGQYYRAADSKVLSRIFSNINERERLNLNRIFFVDYTELAYYLIKIGLVLLLLGIFLDSYYFIRIHS